MSRNKFLNQIENNSIRKIANYLYEHLHLKYIKCNYCKSTNQIT